MPDRVSVPPLLTTPRPAPRAPDNVADPEFVTVPAPETLPPKANPASDRLNVSRLALASVTAPAIDPVAVLLPTCSVPPVTDVPPVYVFAPTRVRVPTPALVSPPVPEIVPSHSVVSLSAA